MEVILFPLITWLASLTGSASGLGFPLLMLPLAAAFFPLKTALLLTGCLHLTEGLRKLISHKRLGRVKLVWGFMVPALVGSFAGAVAISKLENSGAVNLFGLYLITYLFFIGFGKKLRVYSTAATTIGWATASGFTAGFFGTGKAFEKIILKAYDFPKKILITTTYFSALVIDLGRVSGYLTSADSLSLGFGLGLLFSLPALYWGKKLAAGYKNRFSKIRLRLVVLTVLLLLSGYLLAV